MRDRGHRFGGLITLEQGIDLALDPPEAAPSYVTPTLTSWMCGCYDFPTYATIIFNGCVTAGEPCIVKFVLVDSDAPKIAIGMPWSTPYQNSPHYSTWDEHTASKRGQTYDLHWFWTVDGGSDGPIIHDTAVIYVPAAGEGDSFQMG